MVHGPLWVARLAPGHLSQAAQHVWPSLPSALLSQELVQDSQQGEKLAAGQKGRILGGEHGGDLQPERRRQLSKDHCRNNTASSNNSIYLILGCIYCHLPLLNNAKYMTMFYNRRFTFFQQHSDTYRIEFSNNIVSKFSIMQLCAVIFIPRDDVKVAVLRLQVVPEDFPSQLDASPLAWCAVGGAFHEDGPDGGLSAIYGKGVAIVAEQLQRVER